MSHFAAQALADLALFSLVICLPAVWAYYTLRVPDGLRPEQYVPLFVVATVAGIVLFLPALVVVALVALLGIALAWVSAHFALSGVAYERTIFPARLFPGDRAELTIRLHNPKPLPLAWTHVTDPVWVGVVQGQRKLQQMLRFESHIENGDNGNSNLSISGAVGPFGTLEHRIWVTGVQRGVYTIGPGRVSSGDPFGVFSRVQQAGLRQEIIVYPRVYSPAQLGFAFQEALGNLITRRLVVADPTLIAGSREYQQGDPLRHIHWRSTARTATLQVRVTEPSTTAQIMIVLNLNTFHSYLEGLGTDRMEAAIQIAASLAVWGLGCGFAVGIHSNGVLGGADADSDAPRIAPSADSRQPALLLEHLARLTFSGRFSPEFVVFNETRHMRRNTTILLVTSVISHELTKVLTLPQAMGRVSVMYCGRSAAPVIPGVPIHLAIAPRESSDFVAV